MGGGGLTSPQKFIMLLGAPLAHPALRKRTNISCAPLAREGVGGVLDFFCCSLTYGGNRLSERGGRNRGSRGEEIDPSGARR